MRWPNAESTVVNIAGSVISDGTIFLWTGCFVADAVTASSFIKATEPPQALRGSAGVRHVGVW